MCSTVFLNTRKKGTILFNSSYICHPVSVWTAIASSFQASLVRRDVVLRPLILRALFSDVDLLLWMSPSLPFSRNGLKAGNNLLLKSVFQYSRLVLAAAAAVIIGRTKWAPKRNLLNDCNNSWLEPPPLLDPTYAENKRRHEPEGSLIFILCLFTTLLLPVYCLLVSLLCSLGIIAAISQTIASTTSDCPTHISMDSVTTRVDCYS